MKKKGSLLMSLFLFFIVLIFLILLIGCERNVIFNPTDFNNLKLKYSNVPVNEQNKKLDLLSKALAKQMVDKKMRLLLKNEIITKFDGDYEVLMQKLFFKKNAQFTYFKKQLLNEYAKLSMLEGVFNKSLGVKGLEEFIKNEKLLQIAVPYYGDKWDVETEIPIVVYLPYGVDEEKIGVVKGYDSEGNEIFLPIDKDPGKPVVVIGFNERIKIINANLQTLPDDGEGGGGYSPPPTPHGPRIDGGWEYLEGIKIYNDHEPFLKGKPEIYIVVGLQTGTSVKKELTDVDEENIYYYYHLGLFRWYWSTYGVYYKIEVAEHDAGDWTITVSYKDGSISITIPDGDDSLGEGLVHKNDPYNEKYDTGDSSFWITYDEN